MTGYALLDDLPEALHVELADRGRGRLLTVRGGLDLATAPTLERALASQTRRPGPLVLDLRGLSFIDATGLAVLLGAATDARRHRCTLELVPGDAVTRLLELCGVRARFSYTDAPAS